MRKEVRVAAVRRDDGNDICAFKLDDGRELNYEQCLAAIDNGDVDGLVIGKDRLGRDTIRSVNDGIQSNNLSHMPEF